MKVRVYEVAKQLNLDPRTVVGLFQSIGVPDVRNHMSSVDVKAFERLKRTLEKTNTHEVPEEGIRRGARRVVKRALPQVPAPDDPVDEWVRALEPRLQFRGRPFKVRRLGRAPYVLVDSEIATWSLVVVVGRPGDKSAVTQVPSVEVTNKIIRHINLHFDRFNARTNELPVAGAGAIKYQEGRLTDHGWRMDLDEHEREDALVSAAFEHSTETIAQTLRSLKGLPWARTRDAQDRLDADLQFVQLKCIFGVGLRQKYQLPDHCRRLIDSTRWS